MIAQFMIGLNNKSMENITFQLVKGVDTMQYIDTLAEKRIDAFKAFPYLYLGDLQQEKDFLNKFCQSKNARMVIIQSQKSIIGLATASPLKEAFEQCQNAFKPTAFQIDQMLYIGECIIDKEFQHQGLGRTVNALLEDEAKLNDFKFATFCSVIRPLNDGRIPENYYQPADIFKKFGYTKHEDIRCAFEWPMVPSGQTQKNEMVFWVKSLGQ